MANGITAKIEDIKASLERLSARERRMFGGLAAAFAAMLVLGLGYWISSSLEELEEKNASMRKALKLIDRHRDEFVAQRQRIAALEVRMARTPLELNNFVEKAASAVGVTITESGETTPVPGARYTRRGLEIKLNKVTIGQLASLLKRIEDEQAYIVQVTRLSVNTRWNRNEQLDVELVVSTYDRNKKDAPGTGGKKRRKRS